MTVTMYIPSAEMGEYDSFKPPPQKKMASKQLLEAKYGSLDRQASKGNMTGEELQLTVLLRQRRIDLCECVLIQLNLHLPILELITL